MLTDREKKIALLGYLEGCADTEARLKFTEAHFRRKTDTPFGYARCWAITADHSDLWKTLIEDKL